MTCCEWVVKDDPDPLLQEDCKRTGHFTVMLKGSNSASNLFFACWQHVKKYRRKKFVEDTFGKGARVEIVDIRIVKKREGLSTG